MVATVPPNQHLLFPISRPIVYFVLCIDYESFFFFTINVIFSFNKSLFQFLTNFHALQVILSIKPDLLLLHLLGFESLRVGFLLQPSLPSELFQICLSGFLLLHSLVLGSD